MLCTRCKQLAFFSQPAHGGPNCIGLTGKSLSARQSCCGLPSGKCAPTQTLSVSHYAAKRVLLKGHLAGVDEDLRLLVQFQKGDRPGVRNRECVFSDLSRNQNMRQVPLPPLTSISDVCIVCALPCSSSTQHTLLLCVRFRRRPTPSNASRALSRRRIPSQWTRRRKLRAERSLYSPVCPHWSRV